MKTTIIIASTAIVIATALIFLLNYFRKKVKNKNKIKYEPQIKPDNSEYFHKEENITKEDVLKVPNEKGYYNPLSEAYKRAERHFSNLTTEDDRIAKVFLSAQYFFEEGNKLLTKGEEIKKETSFEKLEFYKDALSYFEDALKKINEFKDCGRITTKGSDLSILRDNKFSTKINIQITIDYIYKYNQNIKKYENSIPYILKAINVWECNHNNVLGCQCGDKKRDNYNNLGFIYYQIGEYEKAIDYYNKSIELNENFKYPYPFRNIILAYIALEKFEEAEKATSLYIEKFSYTSEVNIQEFEKLKNKFGKKISNIYSKFRKLKIK